jgi:hypothetical protein
LPKARLLGEKLTAGAVPVPERLTVWGLPLALSVTVSEAARLPLAEGVKVTLSVQFAPAATEPPQVFVCAKSLEFVPVIAIPVRLKVALPLLLRVIVPAALLVPTAWFAKERLLGEKLTAGAVPVPERLAVWGLPLALSMTVSEAARLPLAEGVKVTLSVQFAPTATELPQVSVCAKSLALAPVIARLEILKAAFPRLLRVIVPAALLVPTA